MIYLGIDFGDKRMGAAICESEGMFAVSIATVPVRGARDAAEKAAALAAERRAQKIIVGMPERADGYRGERCEKTEVFLSFLRALTEIPIETVEERFTTVGAHELLYAAGKRTKKHRSCVDALSAQIILQSYIDSLKEKK